MTSYSRDTPSPEYLDMVAMYETLHEEGETSSKKSGKDTFSGKMLIQHAPGIAEMITRTGAKSILDYGAGKGGGYERRDITLRTAAGDRILPYSDHSLYVQGVADFLSAVQGTGTPAATPANRSACLPSSRGCHEPARARDWPHRGRRCPGAGG